MSNIIHLKLELQDHYGSVVKSYFKNVHSDYTPTKEMVYTSEGYTLEARTVYFDMNDGNIFVRFVENFNPEDENNWNFLLKDGWEVFKS